LFQLKDVKTVLFTGFVLQTIIHTPKLKQNVNIFRIKLL
jgi:hypothetical protein